MATPVNNSDCWKTPEVYKHHEQRKICISRPKYREGRKAKAVKVYTINLESRYVMVQGVPAIGVMTELIQLCALYGVVEEYRPLDEYPTEEFTEVYLIKFQKLPSARAAKRHMDEKSFYGGVLHVCYVPEYETVEDIRLKLQDRRRYVNRTAQNIAREKLLKEGVKKDVGSSGTAPTKDMTTAADDKDPRNNITRGCSSTSHYLGFPLLPLPPQDNYYGYKSESPTEDKMGTLPDANIEPTQQPTQSLSPCEASSSRDRGTAKTVDSNQASTVRFVPRTTQLENRKRKMEEVKDNSLFDFIAKDKPLIGPKLPEPPKLDMEDESLNTTVNLIRNTMTKVTSVPDIKPAEKKIKPRRRI
ncbi:RNA-binding protein 48 [Lampris incognitus]|uniref:RNA-binding protein 48 n=1 Tax=Lampris incognitus TaxID=2546036 RepID=UPI0024B4D440|nr:RNA-binding protein 48 [Lampris incognitus]